MAGGGMTITNFAFIVLLPLLLMAAPILSDIIPPPKRFYVFKTVEGVRLYVGPVNPGVFFVWTESRRRRFIFTRAEIRKLSTMPETIGIKLETELVSMEP